MHVECVHAAHGGGSAADFHDVARVFDGGFTESAHAVLARVMFFFHEHVEVARCGEQSDGLTGAEAFLCAIAMFFAMLADFEVAGEVNDLAGNRANCSGVRLAVHGRAQSCGAPGCGRFFAHLPERRFVSAFFNSHLGL